MLPLAPLRVRAFRDLWLGQTVSQLGDALYYVVFMFMVAKVTGSYAMVGYVGALETAPYLLFSPYSGVLADRLCRRRIMLASDLLCGSLLALFALYVCFDSTPHFAVIGSVAFLLSSVRVFFWPAKNAAIPRLVPSETLMQANALSQMTANIMFMVGLAFSGGVLAGLYALSPTWFFVLSFGLNALSFFGSAIFIARLPAIQPERTDEPQHPIKEVKEGVKYIRERHELLVLMGLQVLLTLFVSPFFPVYVATNEQWFGGKPDVLLWFEFSFFFGYVMGTAVVGKMKLTRPGLGFIWGIFGVGATVAAMAYSPYFWAFCFWNFAAGIALPFANIPVMTYIQMTVPDAFRGRVNSALNMFSVGIQPLGLAVAGILIQAWGIVTIFLVMGVGMGVAGLLGFLDRPFRETTLPEPSAGDAPVEIPPVPPEVDLVPG